jgi:hypothetical protein
MSHYLSNKALERIQGHTPPRSVEDLVETLKSKIFDLHSNGHMDAIAHQELNTLATDFLLFADAVSDDGR